MLGATKPQSIVDLAGAEVRQPRGGHLSPCCQQEENVLRILVFSGPGGGEEELVLRARTLEEKEEWMAELRTVQEEATCPSGRETESIREESVRGETESIREESVKGETELVSEKSITGLSSNQQVLALSEYKGNETQTKKKQEERSITVGSNISGSPSWLGTLSRTENEEEDMKEFDYDLMTEEADLLLVNKEGPTKSGMIRSVGRQLMLTRSPSRVRLPACVLEPRSLLESYAAAFGRPELFTRIPQGTSCRDRMERAAAFYLSQLMCTRRTPVALKPYNPSLGEWFLCQWPSLTSPQQTVTFLAEQVSHHPPVSAMYAECRAAGMSYVPALPPSPG